MGRLGLHAALPALYLFIFRQGFLYLRLAPNLLHKQGDLELLLLLPPPPEYYGFSPVTSNSVYGMVGSSPGDLYRLGKDSD